MSATGWKTHFKTIPLNDRYIDDMIRLYLASYEKDDMDSRTIRWRCAEFLDECWVVGDGPPRNLLAMCEAERLRDA